MEPFETVGVTIRTRWRVNAKVDEHAVTSEKWKLLIA